MQDTFLYICSVKLSVLIPDFNYDCSRLVRDLQSQIDDNDEVIVGDDCSSNPQVQDILSQISKWPRCKVWRSETNLGRASIRNRLAEQAQGDWLLFIDCDAEVRSAAFISRYKQESKGKEMLCGGVGSMSPTDCLSKNLRWLYEVSVEKKLDIKRRRKKPYECLTTFNFMIRKDVFERIGFDERCIKYGHEDTMFASELKCRGIDVWHIDNKLTHLGIDSNAVFLEKTETALESLRQMDIKTRLHAKVSRLQMRLNLWKGDKIVAACFRVFRSILRRNLLSKRPSLFLFSLYKLGYYCNLEKNIEA